MKDRIETLAAKLLREGEAGDMESARAMATRRLEDSDARTEDPAVHDHEHDGVIRRTSSETAAVGDIGVVKRAHDGE